MDAPLSTRDPKTDHVQRATLHFVNPTQRGLRVTRANTATLASTTLNTNLLRTEPVCADMPAETPPAVARAVPAATRATARVTATATATITGTATATAAATQSMMELGTVHLAESMRIEPRARHEPLNRMVNIVIAGVALVLLAPVLLLIALVVRLTSRGPILYTQVRVGVDRRSRNDAGHTRRVYDLGGAPFTMYKFRTMRVDAEADGRAVWASQGDPRVTPVGRLLRRTRLDELPQLYNVLQGDMNIVGPRPERPALFAQLRENIPDYSVRQRVKPGITGWAQINHSYDTSIDDVRRKVAYDLEYLGRQSLAEDLRIMSLTLPVMFMQQKGW